MEFQKARKTMILCGLALDVNGRWDECYLKPELQILFIDKHRAYFENPDLDQLNLRWCHWNSKKQLFKMHHWH